MKLENFTIVTVEIVFQRTGTCPAWDVELSGHIKMECCINKTNQSHISAIRLSSFITHWNWLDLCCCNLNIHEIEQPTLYTCYRKLYSHSISEMMVEFSQIPTEVCHKYSEWRGERESETESGFIKWHRLMWHVPNACENSNYENGIYYISKTMDLNFVRKYTDSKILTSIRLLISQTREQIVYDINNIGNWCQII